ncbi:MAG: hypothetical protein KBB94_00450 [Legionellaceae bacterium]|nr:hypothetical protein [Legionellaceae bacterium]MBP9774375.1 hypothetical protein [Legionellaceae bacterium]
MGHRSIMIHEMHALGLQPGMVIADCGSQDFAASQIPWANEFLQKLYHVSPINRSEMISAKEIFEHIGFDYTSFDVDRRENTTYLDYQSYCFPRELYGHFDAMFNAGTSEHLIAPITQLFFMHQATKVGGLMWHDVPMFGYGNHGLNNLTPKFWMMLAVYNDYEIVQARLTDVDVESQDPHNFFHEHLSPIEGLREWPYKSAVINIVFRKKHDFCFIPPFDIDDPSPSPHTERIMRAALSPFQKMSSITADEIDTAMVWRFGKTQTTGLGHIEHQNLRYSIQETCDLAYKYSNEGDLDTAKQLLLKVACSQALHEDCWHELALIMAMHACTLAAEHSRYVMTKDRLVQGIKKEAFKKRALFGLAKLTPEILRRRMFRLLQVILKTKKKNNILFHSSVGGFFAGHHSSYYLKKVAELIKEKSSSQLSKAIHTAASMY